MSDTTRKLTVSFGAFSCTLAGFDDPFPVMKQVVDYFQDLSARDPSFGAYPERPDPNALQAIAAAESNGPVEAEMDGSTVLLRRIAEDTPAEENADAPAWDDYDVAPAAAATTGLALNATADALRAADGFGSDLAGEDALEDIDFDLSDAVAAEDSPEDDLVGAVDVAEREPVETDLETETGADTDAEPDHALYAEAEAETDDEDHADPLATAFDEATETTPADGATYEEPDADDIAADLAPEDLDAVETEPMADLAAEPDTGDIAAERDEEDGDTLPDWAAELINDSSPEVAEEPAEDSVEPLELADAASAEAPADDMPEDRAAPPRRRGPPVRRYRRPIETEFEAAFDVDLPEDVEATLDERGNEIEAFGREMAEALREDDPAPEPVETETAEPEPLATERPAPLALTPDPSTQAAIAEEEAALRRVLSSKGNDEDPDLAPSNPLARLRARIADKARSLAGTEKADAPAPLRLGGAPARPDPAAPTSEDAPMVNFGDDVPVVADVSLPKPGRPEPLVLGATEPKAESGEVLHLVPSEPDAPEAEDGAQDLKRFASSMGAATLPELLEASAAYVTLVNGRPSFSRREIFSLFDTLNEKGEISHEDRIKTFSRLLRSGVIERTTDGSFAMSRAAREQYQDRASA